VNILPESEPVTRVIVTQPVQPGAGTASKDEAAVAAAISEPVPGGGLSVGQQYGTSQYRVDPSTGYATSASPLSSYAYPSPTPDTSRNGPGPRTD
jgi:hypothetical protein